MHESGISSNTICCQQSCIVPKFGNLANLPSSLFMLELIFQSTYVPHRMHIVTFSLRTPVQKLPGRFNPPVNANTPVTQITKESQEQAAR